MTRPWWRPEDWLAKTLWAGLFLALASLALVFAWVEPLRDMVPATVAPVEEPPEGVVPAVYDYPDIAQFPFLKQVIGRADRANGTVEVLLPERAWQGWLERVAATQPGADPRLVSYDGRLWRVEER